MLAEGLVSKRKCGTLEQDWQSSGTDEKCCEKGIKWWCHGFNKFGVWEIKNEKSVWKKNILGLILDSNFGANFSLKNCVCNWKGGIKPQVKG